MIVKLHYKDSGQHPDTVEINVERDADEDPIMGLNVEVSRREQAWIISAERQNKKNGLWETVELLSVPLEYAPIKKTVSAAEAKLRIKRKETGL